MNDKGTQKEQQQNADEIYLHESYNPFEFAAPNQFALAYNARPEIPVSPTDASPTRLIRVEQSTCRSRDRYMHLVSRPRPH